MYEDLEYEFKTRPHDTYGAAWLTVPHLDASRQHTATFWPITIVNELELLRLLHTSRYHAHLLSLNLLLASSQSTTLQKALM